MRRVAVNPVVTEHVRAPFIGHDRVDVVVVDSNGRGSLKAGVAVREQHVLAFTVPPTAVVAGVEMPPGLRRVVQRDAVQKWWRGPGVAGR